MISYRSPSSLLQGMLASEIVQLNSQVDGLLLKGATVLGVPSPPKHVLANGVPVLDFSYRTDTKVRTCGGAGKALPLLALQKAAPSRQLVRCSAWLAAALYQAKEEAQLISCSMASPAVSLSELQPKPGPSWSEGEVGGTSP